SRIESYIDARPANDGARRPAPTGYQSMLEPIAAAPDAFAEDFPTRSRVSKVRDELEDELNHLVKSKATSMTEPVYASLSALGFEGEQFVPINSEIESAQVASFIDSSRVSINGFGNRAKSRMRSLLWQTWLDPVVTLLQS